MEQLAAHPSLLFIGVGGLTLAAGAVIFLFNKVLNRVN